MQTMIDRFDETGVRELGAQGFVTFEELLGGKLSDVPRSPGVYFVLAAGDDPVFLEFSVGGHFKGKDPTVPRDALKEAWVEAATVIYIGKANDLRRRLTEYAKFGTGAAIGHYGGRYLWQLEGSSGLRVAWIATPGQDPREVERQMLVEFATQHEGRRPFANLVG
jgi:hypothetical protein